MIPVIKKFLSAALGTEYQSFFDAELSVRSITTAHSRRRLEVQYDAIILPYWASIAPQNVTTEYICAIYRNADWSNVLNGCAITTRFIHNLIVNGIISFADADLFEAYYPWRFSTNPIRSEILSVLTEPRFRKYYSAGLITDRYGTMLSLTDISDTDFVDQQMHQLLSGFLESIKLDISVASISRFRSGKLLCKLAEQYFSVLSLPELNRFRLADIIRGSAPKEQINVARLVKQFIMHCMNIDFFADHRFDFYSRFELYLSNASLDVSLEILSAEDTKKYCFVTQAHSGARLLLYINSTDSQIRDAVASSLSRQRITPEIRQFLFKFNRTLPEQYHNDITQWDYNCFLSQISYARETLQSQSCVSFVISLSNYIFRNINPLLFQGDGIDPVILNRQHLSGELFAGIPIVTYTPNSKTPDANTFIFHYIGKHDSNNSNYPSKSVLVDLSEIQQPEYTNLIKDYLWNAKPSLSRRIATCQQANHFFSFVEKFKRKDILTIQSERINPLTIGMEELLAYKNLCYEENHERSTLRNYLRTIHSLLSYGYRNNYTWIQENALVFLNSAVAKGSGGHPIPSSDLNLFVSAVTHFCSDGQKEFLLSEVIFLLLSTELRLSAILTLSFDCVREAGKPGEYIILTPDKTSGGNKKEIPITAVTAKHLLEVSQKTADWRAACCSDTIKKYLFLAPAHRNGHYNPIRADAVRDYIQKCCEHAGIPTYTPANLRDTYITRAQEYRMRKGLSVAVQNMLTGHAGVRVDTEHYVGIALLDMLQATYGVVIGDPSVPGSCKDTPLPNDQSTYVSNNCGYCSNNCCTEYSYIDCLLCKHFVATVSNIPFFKAQIAVLQSKLPNAETPHDREDINAKIRLLVAYLSHLYTLSEAATPNQSKGEMP